MPSPGLNTATSAQTRTAAQAAVHNQYAEPAHVSRLVQDLRWYERMGLLDVILDLSHVHKCHHR